jgi:hypothetical protein
MDNLCLTSFGNVSDPTQLGKIVQQFIISICGDIHYCQLLSILKTTQSNQLEICKIITTILLCIDL